MSEDAGLDRFLPGYDVSKRHTIRIAAPAAVTFAAAREMDLGKSKIVRALFRCREVLLRSRLDRRKPDSLGLIEESKALGWGILAEVPGREIVMGAITQPWAADVVFRALPPGQFAAHGEPRHVKIAWTLRADPVGHATVFSTETRVKACDRAAWSKFRWYWSLISPGVALIRVAMLRLLKKEAERRALYEAKNNG